MQDCDGEDQNVGRNWINVPKERWAKSPRYIYLSSFGRYFILFLRKVPRYDQEGQAVLIGPNGGLPHPWTDANRAVKPPLLTLKSLLEVHIYLPTYLLPTYLPTYLYTYIPIYLYTYIPIYLYTYIPIYLYT